MYRAFRQTWEEVVRPLILRPQRVQVAALCLRETGEKSEVLLISSRGTGRWIVPKGWPIEGKDGAESAAQEAWEEAGVRARQISKKPVGSYSYDKILKHGTPQPITTNVYRIDVADMADDYPEAGQRKRCWMRPEEAANLVREPQLQKILRSL